LENGNENAKNFNFKNDVTAFNEYWKTHDKDKKGSGYKPLKDGNINMKIS